MLIDSPALLQVADATELVAASDAAIIVLGPNELIQDHVEMVDRLKLIGSDVVGYIYNRAPMPAPLARYQRNGSSARPKRFWAPPAGTLRLSPVAHRGHRTAETVRPLNRRTGKAPCRRLLLSRELSGDVLVDAPGRTRGASGRLLVLYGRLLGPLLGGYLLLDKAFAYIHLPGTPLYVGEMVLIVGALGVLRRHRVPPDPGQGRADPGAARRVLPLGAHPVPARIAHLRDSPRCATSPCATTASSRSSPSRRWREPRTSLTAGSPSSPGSCRGCSSGFRSAWYWRRVLHAPRVPFSGVSVLTHKPGNAAIAALIALGSMWLFPDTRSARSRALWSIVALLVIALSATQNRGGLLGAMAGAVVGLAFLPSRDRLRLIVRAVAVITLGLVLAVQLSLKVPTTGAQGRAFSASQLIGNVLSIGGAGRPTEPGTAGAGVTCYGRCSTKAGGRRQARRRVRVRCEPPLTS